MFEFIFAISTWHCSEGGLLHSFSILVGVEDFRLKKSLEQTSMKLDPVIFLICRSMMGWLYSLLLSSFSERIRQSAQEAVNWLIWCSKYYQGWSMSKSLCNWISYIYICMYVCICIILYSPVMCSLVWTICACRECIILVIVASHHSRMSNPIFSPENMFSTFFMKVAMALRKRVLEATASSSSNSTFLKSASLCTPAENFSHSFEWSCNEPSDLRYPQKFRV